MTTDCAPSKPILPKNRAAKSRLVKGGSLLSSQKHQFLNR